MAYYYKRTDDFENLSYHDTTSYFQKITECYFTSILSLSERSNKDSKLDKGNIGKIKALSKMLKKNYEIYLSDQEISDGPLLQSWISLGAVLEACLQSFLEIYSDAYNRNPFTYSYMKAGKKEIVVVNDIKKLKAFQLINYFFDADGIIQADEFNKGEIHNVRNNRNLIHLFAGELTADWEELNKSLKLVVEIIFDLISRLPEIEDEYGSVNLCDSTLYAEVFNLKHKWFILDR